MPVPTKAARQFTKLHKREVCRYWLSSNCSKGDGCEFKHEYDVASFPVCRKNGACTDPSCILKHDVFSEKIACPNYEAGFCSFGHSCKFPHVRYSCPPPQVSNIFSAKSEAYKWIETKSKGKVFRSAPCPYFKSDSWCPYFQVCAFAH
jgi:hypothetical protein